MKSVVTYNPDSVLSVFDDWDRLVGDFFDREGVSEQHGRAAAIPPVDIREEKERYVLEAELPGLCREGRGHQGQRQDPHHRLDQGRGEEGRSAKASG